MIALNALTFFFHLKIIYHIPPDQVGISTLLGTVQSVSKNLNNPEAYLQSQVDKQNRP